MAGVPLVEIGAGLGHSSENQTVRYLGLTVDELRKAQEKCHDFLLEVKEGMNRSRMVATRPAIRVSR